MFSSLKTFWLGLKPRYQWALGIAILVALWVLSGALLHRGTQEVAANAAGSAGDLEKVRVTSLTSQSRDATLTIRGRTQALHSVDVRAQVEGVVHTIHFDKGQWVKKGDVLCEIMLNDRGAHVLQAKALVDQTSKELQVAQELFKDGFRSKTQMAAAQANYEQAKAALTTSEMALADTKVRAPFDGVVDDRYVDAGDYMRAGDKCELIIAPEPFLAVGSVSEHEVAGLQVGAPASATLITGETVQGKVHFVADRADQITRAFRIEVELPNPANRLRDGISVDIHIPVRQLKAIHISPGILVLDDNGVVGLRAVAAGTVRFYPVQIVSDGPDGMWVSGLPDRLDVITTGQQFVNNGEHVKTEYVKNGMPS